jgi:hypothetical protein
MIEILAGVVAALAAGALAKANEIGGRAVTDAYDGLKSLVTRKLGKGGAVQSVEDDPRSEAAQTTLAEALAKAGLAADSEIALHTAALQAAVTDAWGAGGSNIEVGNIVAKVNVLVSTLVATGRIKLGDIRAETGDVMLTNLAAGIVPTKKA